MTDLEIYKQTQELAAELAKAAGFEIQTALMVHNHLNPKVRLYFDMAVIAQEHLKQHEMSDVLTAWEEAQEELPDVPSQAKFSLRVGILDNYFRIVEEKTLDADSLKAAKKIWRNYITENGLGGSNSLGGDVYNANGELIGIFSYNGRLWEPDLESEGNEYYKHFPSNTEIEIK
ncbi:hypothetical protein F0267_02035 [Vibrio coralliilyticus]|uniref:Uncharacterized protein n=3 Tax=Vibrio TaxID=662 RepID=A0AAN0SH09_9VIBR|nr:MULTISPECIES: hypothetical protein [Vibrio]CAH1587682.1 conserved hypothetical protein [Vibrio jasicida]AIW22444.1 hypothetical protein IX92_25600 [Vibrio coralliilyticus]MCZ2799103.1 hypothetical protein [Vibrio alginolyticus]NOH37005.1 hypothetical protein [Vibrio coralliilyticus]PAW02520.1 hypothetical protein CKJ79_17800 [Vibrio coralliilyticus]